MYVRELHNSLVSDTNDGGLKAARDGDDNIIISDYTLRVHCCHLNLKKYLHVTRACVVVNVVFMLKVYIHHCYPSVIDIWKPKDKIQNAQSRRSGEKSHHIYETYKTQWYYMGVIFMPNHMIWQRLQCAHFLSLIMHSHTVNVYFGVVMHVYISILLTNKQKTWRNNTLN